MKDLNKILFILKKRNIYSNFTYSTVNSGLFNSATFVNEMLQENGVNSTLVQVVDNNEIDKYCHQYKPDIVIIEALWVVPEKFEILQKLHPNIKWIIRLHSELPFLANEGIAIEWLKKYIQYRNVYIGCNSKFLINALEPLLKVRMIYLPNYYKVSNNYKDDKVIKGKDLINIGLFGAIRPMKNSLTQAVAAVNYANQNGKTLNLHINSTRVEQKGEPVIKNIRALFEGSKHNLIEHEWLEHGEFVKLVSQMDVCLQVSLTETYNIVTADAVNVNVPVVTSSEVPFVNFLNRVSVEKDVQDIVEKIKSSLTFRIFYTFINKLLLRLDSSKAKDTWLKFTR